MEREIEIIFVYNADSGLWNKYIDTMHKLISPSTYTCNLCAITHNSFSMKKEWNDFIQKLPVPVRFLHKNEWESNFGRKDELPAVFLRKANQLTLWIDAATIRKLTLEDLKQEITEKLQYKAE